MWKKPSLNIITAIIYCVKLYCFYIEISIFIFEKRKNIEVFSLRNNEKRNNIESIEWIIKNLNWNLFLLKNCNDKKWTKNNKKFLNKYFFIKKMWWILDLYICLANIYKWFNNLWFNNF